MKLIIPMAGMGKRMRPHTLTTPKPLIKIAGKPIVQRLIEDIATSVEEPIEEVGFVIGNFSDQVKANLLEIADSMEIKGKIYVQNEPLGTAHAIYQAKEMLSGKVIVAFADTLFITDTQFKLDSDAVIWTKKVDNPQAYGVVILDENNKVKAFVEKPQEPVSDLAIIGIYYFSKGEALKEEIEYLLDNNIMVKGEYQLTDALENLLNKGTEFTTATIDKWLDCGNKNVTVNTNTEILNKLGSQISPEANIENSIIIDPVYIGPGATLTNSVIGPHVSIEGNSTIKNSVIEKTIIQENTNVSEAIVKNSMIGAHAIIKQKPLDLSISDYSQICYYE